jgi:hypothetical protein
MLLERSLDQEEGMGENITVGVLNPTPASDSRHLNIE